MTYCPNTCDNLSVRKDIGGPCKGKALSKNMWFNQINKYN